MEIEDGNALAKSCEVALTHTELIRTNKRGGETKVSKRSCASAMKEGEDGSSEGRD